MVDLHLLEVLYHKSRKILKSLFFTLLWLNSSRLPGLDVVIDVNHLWTALVEGLSKGYDDTNKVFHFIQMFTILCVSLAQIISKKLIFIMPMTVFPALMNSIWRM